MEAIHLSRLALAGFRNYTSAELALEPGLSVFEGENGHGKSNLLEAAYLLAIAKSPRASNDRELVNWDVAQSGGHVQVLGVARQHDLTVQAQLDIEAPPPSPLGPTSFQKSLRVNGIVRTAAEFVGAINIVFFQADDLELVTGPPSVRRRYLDILISQSDAAYLKNQQRYSRVVMQRNQLLRRIREGQANMDELEFWDSRLSHEGAAIVERRQKAVDDLVTHSTPVHENLSSGGALRLDYRPRVSGTARDPRTGSDFGTASVADNILNALRSVRAREVAQGVTVIGPHRDDLDVALDGKPAGAFASRGQARSIALALKLAEAAVVTESAGRKPILALDDVLSEFDATRRRLVLEGVCDYDQVLLTTADVGLIGDKYLANANSFAVRDGAVSRHAA